MRLFRVIYLASLLFVLSVLGFVLYIFLTPVTPENVLSRVNSLCATGDVAVQINEKFSLTSMTPKPLDCACVSVRLVKRFGKENAARLTETTRQLFVNAIRRTLTGWPDTNTALNATDIGAVRDFFEVIATEFKAKPAKV